MKILKHLYQKHRCKKIVKKNSNYQREKYEDRNVLENIIFPYLLSYHDPKTILDIGREDYQKFYNEFFTGRELKTIDFKKEHEEYGALGNHITDSVVNLKKHFKADTFDLIIMNGVMGWGLDKIDEIEKTIESIFEILKPNGILIIGWNNFKDITVTDPDEIKALKKFEPFVFPLLKSSRFECVNGNHTYNFYKKFRA